MPPFHILLLALLLMITPLYSIAILLFNTEIRPRCRTIRALGGGVIFKASIIFGLGLISLFSGEQGTFWMPLLVAGLAIVAAYRIMQLEGVFNQQC
jgi:hypothetical protein